MVTKPTTDQNPYSTDLQFISAKDINRNYDINELL